jgi:hypothetical protein
MFEQSVTVDLGGIGGIGGIGDAVEDARSCADVLVASVAAQRRVVAERFAAVAAWADLHSPGHELAEVGPERAREAARDAARGELGAEGTPPVSTAGVVELGLLLQTTTRSAETLLRDVLELRHRLPGHWSAVMTGRVEGWQAREVARLTHRLSFESARRVDALVLDAVVGLPWGRAKAVVEGKVIAVDPDGHRARLEEEENRRFVSTRRRSTAAGLRTMIARGHAGDIARLEAMIAHLATLLERSGDPDPADTRRAKALAMLANPALTCVYLAQAHHPTSAQSEPEPAAAPEPQPASAVELAVAFGRVLAQLGTKALDRLRPRSVLYLHLAREAVGGHFGTGVVRVEDPVAAGPISTDQLKAWVANDRITVRPVLDPSGATPVDGYEIPTHLREATQLLHPFEVFPYGTLPTRQADLDHTHAYRAPDDGGPPGQTALANLGPLSRRHHRVKTFDGFTVRQPVTGLFLWRTPTGHWYRVDHRGTTHLGPDRPAILDTAARHHRTAMSPTEAHLHDLVLRNLAA